MELLMFSSPTLGPAYVFNSGVSSSGQAYLTSESANFFTTYTSIVTAYNNEVQEGDSPSSSAMVTARDAAVSLAFSNLNTELNPADWTVLNNLVSNDAASFMITEPGSDIVATQKFTPGGASDCEWDGTCDGNYDYMLIDGYPEVGNSCAVTTTNQSTIDGGNIWLPMSGGSISQISGAFDGTLVVNTTSGIPYEYVAVNNTWNALPGGITELAASSGGYIYGINSSGTLLLYNPASNAWGGVSGAPVLQHISAAQDGSIVGTNGTTVHIYQPVTKEWYTQTGATHSLVNITTASLSTTDSGAGFFAVDNVGEILAGSIISPMYVLSYRGYTGTPEDIHIAANDSSLVLHTTSGVFQMLNGSAVFSAVPGYSGSVVGTDSNTSVYVFGASGLQRYFPSNSIESIGFSYGGEYISVSLSNAINNLPAGQSFTNPDVATVEAVCAGLGKQIFQEIFQTRIAHMAYEKTKMFNLLNTYSCGWWFFDGECGNWSVTAYCTNTPDLNAASVEGDIEPTPWGWALSGLVYSYTGHAPWHGTTAVALLRYVSPQVPSACTSTP